MIFCDHQIEGAIRDGRLPISPVPEPWQYDYSSLNLRVGDDFRVWKASLWAKGTRHHISLDHIDLADIIYYSDPLTPNAGGVVVIEPGKLVLVRTLESVHLPLKSKLAARVEGRSKQARLGMTAHITAPTIHAGFRGRIVLEILNFGPFYLEARVNHSMLCQLIVEEVKAVPTRGGSQAYSDQATPLGTPKKG